MRPMRWWLHRHQAVRSGWVDWEWFERCSCGAGRFFRAGQPRPWVRLDPWPRSEREIIRRLQQLAEQGNKEIARLRGLLARLEWAGGGWGEEGACPACCGWREGEKPGHDEDCWLATELTNRP